jgi:hypothetical protein
VIEKHARARRREADPHQLAVDAHLVVGTDFLAYFGRLPVHRNASGNDHLLQPAQRAVAALRQQLVQALRLGEDRLSGASGLIRAGPIVRPPRLVRLMRRVRRSVG